MPRAVGLVSRAARSSGALPAKGPPRVKKGIDLDAQALGLGMERTAPVDVEREPIQVARHQRLRRGFALMAPLLVVAVGAAFMAWYYYVVQGYLHPLDFADLGAEFAGRVGLQGLATSQGGYDGQFAYFIARHPAYILTCAHHTGPCPMDDGALRSERILYPITAALLTFGHLGLLPYTLLLVNYAAIVITALLIGDLSARAGHSRWLGVGAGLFAGQVLALLRDLSEPYALLWAVLAVWLARRGRPLWAAVAVAAALLAREQLLFMLPLLALPLIAERRWGRLVLAALIGLGPFVAWQVMLRALFGHWPLLDSSRSAPLLHEPFKALWLARHTTDFGVMVLCVAVPLVASGALAAVVLWRDQLAGLLRDPIPLMVLIYGVLVSFTGVPNWQDMWAPARLAAPGIVLGVLVAARLSRSVSAAYATLLAVTVFAPILLKMR